MDVGARIRQLRKDQKLTQRKLAVLTNISQPVINKMENNKKQTDVEDVGRLCVVFGITLSHFFNINGSLLEALPAEVQGFVLDPANLDLLRAIKEMLDAGYNKEGIISWLQGLQKTVAGLAQGGLLAGQIVFDPAITEDTTQLHADFVEKRSKIK